MIIDGRYKKSAYSSLISCFVTAHCWCRLFADILNDAAICLELLSPVFKANFRLIVCLVGICRVRRIPCTVYCSLIYCVIRKT